MNISKNVIYPYCDKEIPFSWGLVGKEGKKEILKCDECGKLFNSTTYIRYEFITEELPCKNGGPHHWYYMFKNAYKCFYCDCIEEFEKPPEEE